MRLGFQKYMVVHAKCMALILICLCSTHTAFSQTTNVEVSSTQAPSIKNGERLSEWMLKERQIQDGKSQIQLSGPPYYLGTSWLTPKEINTQVVTKIDLIISGPPSDGVCSAIANTRLSAKSSNSGTYRLPGL